MSIFKKKLANKTGSSKVQQVTAAVNATGGALFSKDDVATGFAQESADDNYKIQEVGQSLVDALGDDVPEFAQESATYTAMVAADPMTAVRAAQSFTPGPNETLIGSVNFAQEGYEDRDFTKFVSHSIVFNSETANQGRFAELFFPTILSSADEPVMVSTINSTVITSDVRHKLTGEVTDTKDVNLAYALSNPEMLTYDSITVHPGVAEDSSNADKFVAASDYPVKTIDVEGTAVKTSALIIGKELNIMGLAANAANLDGAVLDLSDVLDSSVGLKSVVVKVTELGADGVEGGGDDTVSVIEVPVRDLPRAQFVPAIEGSNDELELRFINQGFILEAAVKDVTGAPASALSALSTNTATLAIELFGSVNMRTSNIRVQAAPAGIASVVDADGAVLSMTSGAGQDIAESLQIEVLGYTIDARRTNSNRRSTGLSVDTRSKSVLWAIGSQQPLYSRIPTTQAESEHVVEELVATARLTSGVRAVTTLMEHVARVAAFRAVDSVKTSDVFKGASDEVKPYYKLVDLDVKVAIDSLSTAEKTQDLRGLLVDTITHEIALMASKSNYATALDILSPGEKLRAIIGTDQIIEPYLMVQGEGDTFGKNVDFEIASTQDPRMSGKLIVTFQRTKEKGFGPLSAGARGMIPELIGSTQVTRNGATSKELIVEPRELHQAVLPVVLEIRYTNLTELLSSAVN